MPTIRDVAQRAGVSTATVTRHLRGEPVRTAEAIQQAVDELGYVPNAIARSLKSGRHGTVGVVVPDITNPYFAAVVKGMERVARSAGVRMLLANSDESTDTEADVLDDLVDRVDGLIIAPATENDESPPRLRRQGIPLVFLDREIGGDEPVDAVLVDNVGGARAAADHLVGLGHRRIAMINGPVDTTPGRGRREGFLAALEAAGVDLDPDHDLNGDFREPSGRRLTLQLLSLSRPPTALFVANNAMTVGALKALQEMRVDVPRAISVIGFDDIVLGSLLNPPLTCISRPDVQQGALAMRLLLGRLDDADSKPSRVVLDTELTVRGSTAPPTMNGA
ncbi:MAG: LacI family DNA-binding transcriptional regulator [Nocardioidaceae bacterium]